MRTLIALVLFPTAVAVVDGCAHVDSTHAAPIAAAAYLRDGRCPESTRTDVVPIGFGYRLQGCGAGASYYRCSNEHYDHTLRTSRLCCYRVKDEDALRDSLFSQRTGDETCDE